MTTQQQDLSPFMFDFYGDFTVPGGGDNTHDFVANTLQDKVLLYNSDQFIADRDGLSWKPQQLKVVSNLSKGLWGYPR